jgi:hypothetical protein
MTMSYGHKQREKSLEPLLLNDLMKKVFYQPLKMKKMIN